jgi:thiamine-phosphate pyrophosphorylase
MGSGLAVMIADDKLHRIMDANANRAREGLRVVEEHLRLVRDNADFTARVKALRHAVTGAIISMKIDDKLIQARQSDTDVGATEPVGPEGDRTSSNDIVTANLRRSQEALRVLEEYSKLVSLEASAEFKRLRFETYTLEKDIMLHAG